MFCGGLDRNGRSSPPTVVRDGTPIITSLSAATWTRFVRFDGVRTRMTANGKTVLLVEDNEDNRIVYSTILRHFGYSVTEALNGEEGIAKARSEKPDLILMDISIPVIDGWEATQVLKHDPQTREIPIIALTAHALASDREKAMEVGCDGYLAKPCEPRAVVAEVQRFLGKGNGTVS
jgi:CheY-like chemotaxis protein